MALSSCRSRRQPVLLIHCRCQRLALLPMQSAIGNNSLGSVKKLGGHGMMTAAARSRLATIQASRSSASCGPAQPGWLRRLSAQLGKAVALGRPGLTHPNKADQNRRER